MKKINAFILSMDMVGMSYRVTHSGSSRSQTLIGSFFTLILGVVMVTGVVLLGNDIVFKAKPLINRTQTFSQDNEILMNKIDPIAYITDIYGNFHSFESELGKSIELLVEVYQINVGKPPGFFTYQFTPCSEAILQEEHKNQIDEEFTPYEIFRCIDYSSGKDALGNPVSQELFFRNEYTYSDGSLIQIKVKACDESKNPGCRKGMDDHPTFFVGAMNILSFIDLSDFDHPQKTYSQASAGQVSKDLYQRDFLKFRINSVETDAGFILEDIRKEEFFDILSKSKQTLLYSEATRNLYGINYEVSFLKDNYTRKYLKIQELAANIGGFMKACIMVASSLVYYYSEYCFYISSNISEGKPEDKTVKFNVPASGHSSTLRIKDVKWIGKGKANQFGFWIYFYSFFSKKTRFTNKIDRKAKLKIFDMFEINKRLEVLEGLKDKQIKD